jgi:hypothetical protein
MPKKHSNERKTRRVPNTKGSRPLQVTLSAEQRKMLADISSEIDRTRRELGDEQSRLDALRCQHTASQQAHAMAMREHQALLLARVDEHEVAEADRRVREVDDRSSALSAAIAAQETKVSQLAAKLADAKAREVEGKAQEADAHAVALERALGNLKPVMGEFTDAFCAAGSVVPEPMAIGRTMSDIFRHVENDTAYCAELLRQRARALRQEPPPALPVSKDTRKPKLMPQAWRQSGLLKLFHERKARAAARVYAGAKRTQSWWASQQSDAAERFFYWNTRAADRIRAEAKRAQSRCQRLLAWRAIPSRLEDGESNTGSPARKPGNCGRAQAGLLITTEATVAERPKKEYAHAGHAPGGGMDY